MAALWRRYSCMTVVGAGQSSSRGLFRGRLAPQVKQIRSSGLTSAAQLGQVSVAIMSSWTPCRRPRPPPPASFDERRNAHGRADLVPGLDGMTGAGALTWASRWAAAGR